MKFKDKINYLDLSDCPLSHKSAMSVINGLGFAKIDEYAMLWLNSKRYNSLTDAELKIG